MPEWLLIVVEFLFVILVATGIWFIFWPAALIVVGCAGIFACERASIGQNDVPEAE